MTHKFTSLRLSSDGHEWDFEKKRSEEQERGSSSAELVSSVLKFSKCLKLLPSILQHICLSHEY